MKKCQACGFENENDSLFCAECGKKFESNVEQKFCQHCGAKTVADALFCAECGKPLQVQEAKIFENKIVSHVMEEPKKVETPKPVAPAPKPATPVQKKASIIPIIIIAVLLVLVLGVGIFFVVNSGIFGGKDSDDDTKVENNIDEDEDDEDADDEDEDGAAEEEESASSVDTSARIPVAATASASSSLDNVNFGIAALTDMDATTAWAEGVAGFGVGESITFTLGQETEVYGLAVVPGVLTSATAFYSNGYPTEFEVSAGGVTSTATISYYTPDFSFASNPFVFLELSEPVTGSEITVTIKNVQESTLGDTTCITEMHLYTHPSEGSNVAVADDAWDVVSEYAGDYILPTSNSEYLTEADLAGLTAEECRLARNELYARYGRKFTDETLQAYFNGKDWYMGTIEPEDFTEDMLNEYEVFNRDLIVDYEEAQGYR